jgi:hypothetical protein
MKLAHCNPKINTPMLWSASPAGSEVWAVALTDGERVNLRVDFTFARASRVRDP